MRSYCILSRILVILAYSGASALSQPVVIPQANKPSNMGREFYFLFPTSSINASGFPQPCINLFCPVDADVEVSAGSDAFFIKVHCKPYQITTVELPVNTAMAYQQDYHSATPPDQLYPGKAIHISATFPIAVTAVNVVQHSTESFPVLPVEALGREYIVTTFYDCTWDWKISIEGYFPAQALIVAIADQTAVDISLGGTLTTETAGGLKAGFSRRVYLNKGDVYSIATSSKGVRADITGTKIVSSKPVYVLCGNLFANAPPEYIGGAHIAESQMPTQCWGTQCYMPRNPPRKTAAMMKLVAKDSNTQVAFNGKFSRVLSSSGGLEGRAYATQRVHPQSNTVALYTASKPVNATFFETSDGCDEPGVQVCKSFQMNVVPREQFGKELYIVPVNSRLTGFMTEHYLGIVVQLTSNGTIPDDVEFGVAMNGSMSWRKLTAVFGPSIYTDDRYPLFQGELFGYKVCKISGNDVVALRSSRNLACYLFGGEPFTHYGHFAATMAFDRTRSRDSLAPLFEFEHDIVSASGIVTDVPSDSSIRSNLSKVFLNYGSTNVRLSAESIYSADVHLLPWRIDMTDSTVEATAYLTASDRAGNDTTITIQFPARNAPLIPVITVRGGTELCAGDSVELQCGGGFSRYVWSTGDTTQRVIIRPKKAGTYYCTVSAENADGVRLVSKSVAIIVRESPENPHLKQSLDTVWTRHVPNIVYVWYCNDTLLENERAYFVVAKKNGRYRLHVVDAVNGCHGGTDSLEFVIPVKSTVETASPELRIYPIPSQNILTVEHDGSATWVKLFDIIGEEVPDLVDSSSTGIFRIDISKVRSGIYILAIRHGMSCSYFHVIRD